MGRSRRRLPTTNTRRSCRIACNSIKNLYNLRGRQGALRVAQSRGVSGEGCYLGSVLALAGFGVRSGRGNETSTRNGGGGDCVRGTVSAVLTSALCSISSRTTASWPFQDASMRQVLPYCQARTILYIMSSASVDVPCVSSLRSALNLPCSSSVLFSNADPGRAG